MAITKLVIAFLLLVSSAFIGYSTYTGTQKKVTTSTQAAGTWAQCDRGGSSTGNPTNTPCGSCNITDGSIEINNGGTGTVQFGCELLCNTSGNASDLSNCPTDSAASYTISSTSWFYCSGAGTQACTQGSPGLQSQGSMTQTGKPWTIAKQQTINDFQATFNIPDFEPCGRVQVDVQINAPGISVAGDVFDTETDCTVPPTNTPTPTITVTPTPTPPTGGGTAQCPYTNIDTQFRKTGTTEWISGDTLTSQITGVPVSIDINCFATNESGQRTTMNPADILVNNTNLESNGGGQITNYQVTSAATYTITCKYSSEAVTNCQNNDSFVVSQGATATPAPTATPTITNTPTPSNSPTPTVTKTPTPTPSNTPVPTNTPTPTSTPTIVATAVPTATATSVPPPTATAVPPTVAPTETPTTPPTVAPTVALASATPTPTQAKLTVNNQAPGGILPWLLLSIPTTLLLLGLLL